MIKFIVLACLFVATVHCTSYSSFSSFDEALEHAKSQHDFDATYKLDSKHFEVFKSEHNKFYATEEEHLKRFNIFRVNLLKIKLLNLLDAGSAVYKVNEFADLDEDEFKAKYTGLTVDREQIEKVVDFTEPQFDKNAELPKEVDWREQGAVTEVKNQAQCGSCWAFSAVGAIESQNKIKNGELVRLSEQQLVDCDEKSQGCRGGFMSWAFEAVQKLGGVQLEKDYEYTGRDGKCAFDQGKVAVKVESYTNLTQNEDEIAQYVAQNGPVSLAINANLMQFYGGGVAHPNFLTKWLCSPSGLNHGVLLVGFGETKTRFTKRREPYWIIKNSWGPKYGRQGYYYIHRGSNACGVAQFVSAPVVAKKINK